MRGKAHLLCSSLSNFAPAETKLPCLILLQGYVVVGNPASPNAILVAKSKSPSYTAGFITLLKGEVRV